MVKSLKIEKKYKSFLKRNFYFIATGFIALLIFYLLFLFNDQQQNLIYKMSILTLAFGIPIGVKMWENKLYVFEIESYSNQINIKYYDINIEKSISSLISKSKVSLKYIPTKSGSECKLKLKIDNHNFVISDRFDWSRSEIKKLFEYIKYFKNESLTEKEKMILSKIEKK